MSAPRILVVDDEAEIRNLVQEILGDEGYAVEVAANAAQARSARAKHEPDLILLDIWMPDTDGITLLREWVQSPGSLCPVVMMSGHGTVETAVEATRLGAFDFVEKPLSLAKLLRTVNAALTTGRRKRQDNRTLVPPVLGPVGRSSAMQKLREQLQRVAVHNTAALLVGEAGTGREMLARYIHGLSSRAAEPFVTISASAIADNEAAAALCGVGPGGSVRKGFLDEASGGMLFIDEITQISATAARLLRDCLERRSFMRVNGDACAFDARIVCSLQPGASPNPDAAVEYRELLTHLNAITIHVPPLRECAEDIPELLRHHAESLVDEERLPLRRFGVAAQNRMRNYPWPGNVRELRNLVRRLLILGGNEAGDREIVLEDVERELRSATSSATTAPSILAEPLVKQDLLALPLREAREQFERAYLLQQLMLCNGKVGQLAKRVGIERTHLYRKLRALGVDFRQLADD
jgi:two-component system, NtrC family, nitrogen regulation response regulator NtrX